MDFQESNDALTDITSTCTDLGVCVRALVRVRVRVPMYGCCGRLWRCQSACQSLLVIEWCTIVVLVGVSGKADTHSDTVSERRVAKLKKDVTSAFEAAKVLRFPHKIHK